MSTDAEKRASKNYRTNRGKQNYTNFMINRAEHNRLKIIGDYYNLSLTNCIKMLLDKFDENELK